jgi:hypothetical protein
MRLTDAEKEPFRKMREVSELRTQFQCEYRLHLTKKYGDSYSQASVTGSELHHLVSIQSSCQHVVRIEDQLVPFLLFIITLIVGILWIFW